MSENQLTTVHHAVMNAIIEQPAGDSEMVPASFKLHQAVKEEAEAILKRHNVTLSEFCRKCCEGLVRDYIEG